MGLLQTSVCCCFYVIVFPLCLALLTRASNEGFPRLRLREVLQSRKRPISWLKGPLCDCKTSCNLREGSFEALLVTVIWLK